MKEKPPCGKVEESCGAGAAAVAPVAGKGVDEKNDVGVFVSLAFSWGGAADVSVPFVGMAANGGSVPSDLSELPEKSKLLGLEEPLVFENLIGSAEALNRPG